MDAHAGRGIYDLKLPEAQKLQEYVGGINQCWPPTNWPLLVGGLASYVQKLNRHAIPQMAHQPRYYPGSAAIIANILRPTDILHAFELHKTERAFLEQALANQPNTHIHGVDSYLALQQWPIKPDVVFIDPSYEVKSEYDDLPQILANFWRKNKKSVVALWYPLLPANRHEALLQTLQTMVPCTITEVISNPAPPAGLLGAGVALLNLPDNMRDAMQADIASITPWLEHYLNVECEMF